MLPFLGDISLLLIAFFVAFIVAQHLQIVKSETPQEMSIDQYFPSSEYELDPSKRIDLKNRISEDVFPSIKKEFEEGRLRAVRIEGHADTIQPYIKDLSNRELSLYRAHEVNKIFEEIAKEEISPEKYKDFIKRLSPTGKGEFDQKYITRELENGKYAVVVKNTNEQVGESFDYWHNAYNKMLEKNRRIEIITVYK